MRQSSRRIVGRSLRVGAGDGRSRGGAGRSGFRLGVWREAEGPGNWRHETARVSIQIFLFHPPLAPCRAPLN